MKENVFVGVAQSAGLLGNAYDPYTMYDDPAAPPRTADFLLPPGGVELPVVGRGHEFGRLVMFAPDAARASLQKRLVAVAIADELGITLATQSVG